MKIFGKIIFYKKAIEAVKKNGYEIEYVYKRIITQELCDIAFEQTHWSMQYIPEKYKTKKMCEMSINYNGLFLQFIPDKYKTQKLCDIAFKSNILSFPYIPGKYMVKENCYRAVNFRGIYIQYVPEEIITKDLCLEAISNDFNALKFIPNKYKTSEFYDYVLKEKNHNKIFDYRFVKDASAYIPENILKGNFPVDKENINSLRAYIRFTSEEKQTEEYIRAFLIKASLADIDEMGNYISLENFPKDMVPLLISTNNKRLKKYVHEQLGS